MVSHVSQCFTHCCLYHVHCVTNAQRAQGHWISHGGIGIPMGFIITEAIGIPIPPRISWGGRIPMGYGKSNGVLEFQLPHWNSKEGPYCHPEKRCLGLADYRVKGLE